MLTADLAPRAGPAGAIARYALEVVPVVPNQRAGVQAVAARRILEQVQGVAPGTGVVGAAGAAAAGRVAIHAGVIPVVLVLVASASQVALPGAVHEPAILALYADYPIGSGVHAGAAVQGRRAQGAGQAAAVGVGAQRTARVEHALAQVQVLVCARWQAPGAVGGSHSGTGQAGSMAGPAESPGVVRVVSSRTGRVAQVTHILVLARRTQFASVCASFDQVVSAGTHALEVYFVVHRVDTGTRSLASTSRGGAEVEAALAGSASRYEVTRAVEAGRSAVEALAP